MMRLRNRLEFTAPAKRQILKRSGGICECHRIPALMAILDNKPCGCALTTGNIEYDHVVADALRPDNSPQNGAALTRTCHKLKSALSDVPAIAEAKRRFDRHYGIKPTPRQVLLGTIRSGVKRPIDGPPVWRDSGRQWPRGSQVEEPNGIIGETVPLVGRVPVIGREE